MLVRVSLDRSCDDHKGISSTFSAPPPSLFYSSRQQQVHYCPIVQPLPLPSPHQLNLSHHPPPTPQVKVFYFQTVETKHTGKILYSKIVPLKRLFLFFLTRCAAVQDHFPQKITERLFLEKKKSSTPASIGQGLL